MSANVINLEDYGAAPEPVTGLWSELAEQSALGAHLHGGFDERLTPAAFFDASHRAIFTAMQTLRTEGKAVDTVTVVERLRTTSQADDCGGIAYLTALAQSVPSASNLASYVDIILGKAKQRDMLAAADRLRTAALAGADVGAAAAEASRQLASLASAGETGRARPEPKPLPPELLPVEPFPMEALPVAFAPWVADVATRMHCPPDFVAVPMLVAAASLVARHVGIRPQRRTDWLERGNLWALIVGRPGIMKSPAMAQALAPIERLEARAAEAFNQQAAEHRAAALTAKLRADANVKTARGLLQKNGNADVAALLKQDATEDAEPTRSRYVVNDLTYEKLGEILAANPDGVLSVRDEVRGLLLSLAREESAPARAFYLQAWSGGSYTFDRIQRGTVTVADARLSIIGGIQPGPLAEMVQAARRGTGDDGMIERFLIAWPDAPGEWREVDRWPDSEGRRLAWETFDRLDALTADALGAEYDLDFRGDARGLPFLRFDDAARDAFGEWRSEFESTIRSAEGEGLEGALSKFRHHVPALALTMHVIDGGTGPVGLPAMARALDLAVYFESHARRLHSSGQRQTVRAARAIVDKAREGALPNPFTARDVYRNQWAGLSDRATVADALDMLGARGWLIESEASTGGRPTTYYSLTEGARRG